VLNTGRPSRVSRARWLALVAVFGLIAGACSDDDDSATTASAVTTQAPASTQAPVTTQAPTTEATTTTTEAAVTSTIASDGPEPAVVITDVGFDAMYDGYEQDGWVWIRNVSDKPQWIGGHFLCQRPGYFALPDVELAPGEGLLVASQTTERLGEANAGWPEANGALGTLSPDSGEMALYSAQDFDNPLAMVSYVEWGESGHGRSSVAVAAGLWGEGGFVDTRAAEEVPGAITLVVGELDFPFWDTAGPPFETPIETTLGSDAIIQLGMWGLGITDEVGAYSFGYDPDTVIAAVTGALGPPTIDSGWGPHPLFEGSEYRYVAWGDSFTLSFGDNDSGHEGAAGTRHFQAYEYFGSPPGLVTPEGIGVGSTVGDLYGAIPAEYLELVYDAIAGTPRIQFYLAMMDYQCFHVESDLDSSPIYGITGGYPCSYGGE